ncbi:MAG: NAD kinase [Bacteroidales bacterium]|nr:NAD kinase [Bacteroidales bacterium]
MIIAIYGKHIEPEYVLPLKNLLDQLKKYNTEIWLCSKLFAHLQENLAFTPAISNTFADPEEMRQNAEILISLGGDGTFLESVELVGHAGIPVMGINFGRLGFLANISILEMNNAIDLLMAKQYEVEERSMLEIQTSNNNAFGDYAYALNDFTIQKSGTSMLKVNAYIDEEYLGTYWADGLIVSTPTGSTAYSLSVGGPIVSPNVSAFVLSAIAPHHLTVRPLIIPNTSTLKLEACSRDNSVLLSLDSKNSTYNTPTTVFIKKAPFKAKIICIKGSSFYKTLRGKLLWGADKRN